MEITFLNIEYLWLLVGLPMLIILHFYSLRYIHNRAIKFANFEALERVTGGIVLSRNFPLLFIRLIALLFLTLSLAGATLWYKGQSNTADYILAIDNSGSMLANDLKPNRLEAAKEAANSFVENLESDSKVGVVSFSGSALLELSPTNNKKKIQESIKNIEISSLHGTAIGDAIKTGANTLVESDKSRILIILTDGQENVASYDDLVKIVEFVKSKQITVNTIGAATTSGGTLPGTTALSTLDEDTLKFVANETGGSYIHSESNDELINAYKSFSYKSIESKIPVYLRLPLIIITLLILFSEWILVNTKYRTIP